MNRNVNADVSRPMPATPEAALRQARLVIGALILGPVLMWLVMWFVTGGGSRPAEPVNEDFTAGFGLTIWTVLAIGGFAGALVFRGRAMRTVEESQRAGHEAVFARAGEVQTWLIIAMALIEGPALFAGVMFFLFGESEFLLYAAPLLLIGAALLFPRAEWFGADAARRPL